MAVQAIIRLGKMSLHGFCYMLGLRFGKSNLQCRCNHLLVVDLTCVTGQGPAAAITVTGTADPSLAKIRVIPSLRPKSPNFQPYFLPL